MDYATDFNLASLEEATREHQRWLGLYRALVTKAIRLGRGPWGQRGVLHEKIE